MSDTEKKETGRFVLEKSFLNQNGISKTRKLKKLPSLAFFYPA